MDDIFEGLGKLVSLKFRINGLVNNWNLQVEGYYRQLVADSN
jgi:hypothetical protein